MATLKDYYLPERHLKMLHCLLRVTDTIMKKNNITYWVDGGTLLGCVRHRGQVPWDDDVDIGIMAEDMEMIPKIAHHFFAFGYAVQKVNDNLWKIYVPFEETWIKGEHNSIGTPTLDIFAWKKEEGRIVLNDPICQDEWPGCYHNDDDFLPLKEYDFHNFKVMGPANPIPYLDRMYRKWWKRAVVDIRTYDDNKVTQKIGTKKFNLLPNY